MLEILEIKEKRDLDNFLASVVKRRLPRVRVKGIKPVMYEEGGDIQAIMDIIENGHFIAEVPTSEPWAIKFLSTDPSDLWAKIYSIGRELYIVAESKRGKVATRVDVRGDISGPIPEGEDW